MNNKELSLTFGIGIMLDSLLIAWSIKGEYEKGNYFVSIFSIVFLIFLVILLRHFINFALKKGENKIELEN